MPPEMPGFVRSGNATLSAMRIADNDRWKRTVITAIRLNHGIIMNAAVALGVHRNTLQRWVNKYADLRTAVQEAQREA